MLGGEADVKTTATRLVGEALERGRDNVTALVIDVGALR